MKILFNGFTESFDSNILSVQDLLDITAEDDPAVIVEINGRLEFFRYSTDDATQLLVATHCRSGRRRFVHSSAQVGDKPRRTQSDDMCFAS